MIFGFLIKALAKTTLCFSPPLNSDGYFFNLSTSLTFSKASLTSLILSLFLIEDKESANETFSSTVKLSSKLLS